MFQAVSGAVKLIAVLVSIAMAVRRVYTHVKHRSLGYLVNFSKPMKVQLLYFNQLAGVYMVATKEMRFILPVDTRIVSLELLKWMCGEAAMTRLLIDAGVSPIFKSYFTIFFADASSFNGEGIEKLLSRKRSYGRFSKEDISNTVAAIRDAFYKMDKVDVRLYR